MAESPTRKEIVDMVLKQVNLSLQNRFFFNQLSSIPHKLGPSSLYIYVSQIGKYACMDFVGKEIYISANPVEKNFHLYLPALLTEISQLVETLRDLSRKTHFAIRACNSAQSILNTPGEVEMLPPKSYFLDQVLYWYSEINDKYLRVDPTTASVNWLIDPSDDNSTWQYPSELDLQKEVHNINYHYINAYEEILQSTRYLGEYLNRGSAWRIFSAN